MIEEKPKGSFVMAAEAAAAAVSFERLLATGVFFFLGVVTLFAFALAWRADSPEVTSAVMGHYKDISFMIVGALVTSLRSHGRRGEENGEK